MPVSKELIHNALLSWETQEDNISCFYKEEPIDFKIRFLHCHDGYEVLMMKRGSVDMQIEDRMISLHPGDIVLIPPYVFHFARQQSTDTYCRVVLNMKEALIQSLIASDESYRHITDAFYQTPDYHIHVNGSTFRQLIDLACALEAASGNNTDLYGTDILSRSLLSIILVILNRQSFTFFSADTGPQYARGRKECHSLLGSESCRRSFRVRHCGKRSPELRVSYPAVPPVFRAVSPAVHHRKKTGRSEADASKRPVPDRGLLRLRLQQLFQFLTDLHQPCENLAPAISGEFARSVYSCTGLMAQISRSIYCCGETISAAMSIISSEERSVFIAYRTYSSPSFRKVTPRYIKVSFSSDP